MNYLVFCIIIQIQPEMCLTVLKVFFVFLVSEKENLHYQKWRPNKKGLRKDLGWDLGITWKFVCRSKFNLAVTLSVIKNQRGFWLGASFLFTGRIDATGERVVTALATYLSRGWAWLLLSQMYSLCLSKITKLILLKKNYRNFFFYLPCTLSAFFWH